MIRRAYQRPTSPTLNGPALKIICPLRRPRRASQKIHATPQILDAIFFYVLPSRCPWSLLPHDLESIPVGRIRVELGK
jgi:hypothetical protein